ncbi:MULTISPECIES: EAL domain-containing protein [Bradyrhizobium]
MSLLFNGARSPSLRRSLSCRSPHAAKVSVPRARPRSSIGSPGNWEEVRLRSTTGRNPRVALDEFGTGYATLSQLLSFRLDKIKIDRSFVSDLDNSTDSRVIVRAILNLARGFGLTTTAEGIEDERQLVYLAANGCTEGQGYLFSGAVTAAGIPALLDREAGRRAVTDDGAGRLLARVDVLSS